MRRGKLRKGVPGKKCHNFPFQRGEKPVRWVRPPAALGRAGGVRSPRRSEADQRGGSETERQRRRKSRKTRPENRLEAGALEGWARKGMRRGKLPKGVPGKNCHNFPFQRGEKPVRWVRPPAALGRGGGVRSPRRSEADQGEGAKPSVGDDKSLAKPDPKTGRKPVPWRAGPGTACPGESSRRRSRGKNAIISPFERGTGAREVGEAPL